MRRSRDMAHAQWP